MKRERWDIVVWARWAFTGLRAEHQLPNHPNIFNFIFAVRLLGLGEISASFVYLFERTGQFELFLGELSSVAADADQV